MQAELDQINQQLGLSSQSMSSLGQQLSGGQDALAALQQDVQLLKAMELLSRARLYLSQGNYGFARADLLASPPSLMQGGIAFQVTARRTGESAQVSLRVPGRHNAANALAAIAAAGATASEPTSKARTLVSSISRQCCGSPSAIEPG